MPRLFILTLIAFLIIANGQCYSNNIAAVKSVDISPYNEAIEAFRSSVNAHIDEVVISFDGEHGHKAAIVLSNENLQLIFTLGSEALNLIKKRVNSSTPVIFTFVLNPESIIKNNKKKATQIVTGISMNIPPYEQFKTLLEAAPKIKNIGTIYDPSKTGKLIEEAKKAAKKLGLNLISTKISQKSEAINAITKMKGKIDAFWMAPDTTAITFESREYMLLFSLRNNIPLIGISEKYVKNGALMAYTFDNKDVGRQAGEIARQILDGKPVEAFAIHPPRKLKLSLNLKVAKKLGLEIPKRLIDKADELYR